MSVLTGKRVLITGGTGSLGTVLVRRLLSGELGATESITIFSRDEAKQHVMRLAYQNRKAATDEVIYANFEQLLRFQIGDVRSYPSIVSALRTADVVFNAAALKQVPTCEYFPFEAVQTNIMGAENIVRALREHDLPVETVVGISTDKAAKPVNVMGMTKAIQERLFIRANLDVPSTRFVCARYGNVLASRGSVIPLFHRQIDTGGPLTITSVEMTRFLLSLDEAVDTVLAALRDGERGDLYVPQVPSARVCDIASVMIGDRPIDTVVTGIRPGEKVHEILVSEEEAHRTIAREGYYVVLPLLPELRDQGELGEQVLATEFSSADVVMEGSELAGFLEKHRLVPEREGALEGDLLL